MNYVAELRNKVASLSEERAALKAEANELTTDETRDAGAVEARADEIIARITC